MKKKPTYLWQLTLICQLLLLNPGGAKVLFSQSHVKSPGELMTIAARYRLNGSYDSAILILDEALGNCIRAGDRNNAFRCRLEQVKTWRQSGNYAQAGRSLRVLAAESRKSGLTDPKLKSDILLEQGAFYLDIGELDSAKVFIDQCIQTLAVNFGENDTLFAPAYNKLGTYYYYEKEFNKALHYYERAYDISIIKCINKSEIPSYIQNQAIINIELGQYQNAATLFDQAISVCEKSSNIDYYFLTKILTNYGKYHITIANYERALIYLDKAERLIIEKINIKHPFYSIVLWNKGLVYGFLGEFSSSLKLLTDAKDIISSNYSPSSPLISSIYMDIAMVLEDTRNFNLSKDYYKKAEISADNHLKQKIYRNLTNFYLNQDSLVLARQYLELCQRTAKECDFVSGYNQALNNLTTANVFQAEGKTKAIDYYKLSLSQLLEIFNENHRDVALVRSQMGNFFLDKKQPDSALHYYQLCLISGSQTFSNPDFLANPECAEFRSDPFFIKLPSSKARAQEMLFQKTGQEIYLQAALESYDLSLCLFEQYSKRYRVENAKMNFRSDYIEIYENAFNAYIEAYFHFGDEHLMHRAFEISEKSRAAILLAEMKDENARKTGLIPDSLLAREKSIRNYLYLYQSKVKDEEVSSKPEKDKLEILRSLQLEYETKYDQLVRIYEEQYPEYYRLRFSPEVVSTRKLQKLLEADEVFIEYCINGPHLDIFTIDRDEIHVVRQEYDPSLALKIAELRNNLKFNKVRDYRYEDFMKYQFTAFELYQRLVEPVNDHLSGKHLIIVPDKDLSYLSFEALINKITLIDTIAFRKLSYLIRDYTIQYASSASVFALTGSNQKPARKSRVLAVAPTYDLKWENIPGMEKVLELYPPVKQDLPGALEEAERIMTVMKGTKLTGSRATEHNFRKLAEEFEILHFSLHTRVDQKNPLSSKMSFHPRGDSLEDGFLHTYEIYNLNLKGHLAVLSACGTGNGQVQRGEGVISLARAFSFAGIHDIILTLWDIEDVTSCFVVPAFYHYFLAGFDKGEALRQSKMLYIARARNEIEAHPVFWAGHALYCNHECTHMNYRPFLWTLLVVSGMIMITLFIIVFKKYKEYKNLSKNSKVDLPG